MSEPQVKFVALTRRQLKTRELYLSGKLKAPKCIYWSDEKRRDTSKEILRASLMDDDFSLSLV